MNPSSSSTTRDVDGRESKRRDNDATSSSSDSESENERNLRKKTRKEEKKRSKKESKSKEKKEKKSKKEKKDKKERKRDRETTGSSNGHNDNQIISEHDAIEMASFREAVQGKQVLVANERAQASLLHASREDIASSLGLPKGLIRTAIDDSSISQRYSKDLFGGDDDNPAKRQVTPPSLIPSNIVITNSIKFIQDQVTEINLINIYNGIYVLIEIEERVCSEESCRNSSTNPASESKRCCSCNSRQFIGQ